MTFNGCDIFFEVWESLKDEINRVTLYNLRVPDVEKINECKKKYPELHLGILVLSFCDAAQK